VKTIRRADASWTTTIETQKEKPYRRCRTIPYAVGNISRAIVRTCQDLPFCSAEGLGVGRALRRLRKFLVGRVGHVSSKLNQDRLHCVIPAPVGKARKLGWIDHAIPWVDTREVDFVNELDSGWLVGVLITAVHL